MWFTPDFFERTMRCHRFGDIAFVPTMAQNGTSDLFGGNILYAALPSVPHAGFGYAVLRGGFTEEAANIFNLWRLKGVSQLSGLRKPSGELYLHSRFAHSLDARAIVLLMALNNRLEEPLVRTLELAGESHDGLTIAYGDRLKGLDPLLDEDTQYPRLLRGEAWEEFRDRYGINEKLLVDAVQGRGLVAELLGMADRLSYLANDVEAFLNKDYLFESAYLDGYSEIVALIAKRKHLFGLWGSVHVQDDRVYIDDPEWLGDVLEARALMFANVYFNPNSRPLGRPVSVVFVKRLLEIGAIKREDLFRFTDAELDDVVRGHFGSEAARFIDSYGERPHVEVFATAEEAQRREHELIQTGESIVLIDAHPGTNSATGMLARSGREILPFRNIFPERAAKIEGIIAAAPTVGLYHFPGRQYGSLPLPLREVANILRGKYIPK